MKNHVYENRKYVLAGIALVIVLCYIIRLAFLQLSDEEYKSRANDNAFFNNVIFPARGVIYDRNGELLVFNQPAYDIMVIMREVKNLDTLDFCQTIGITQQQFDESLHRNMVFFKKSCSAFMVFTFVNAPYVATPPTIVPIS